MPFQGQEVELLPWRLLSRGRGLQPASPCPLSAECPAWPSPAREGLRSPVSPHTLGMGAENAEEKGPWPSSPQSLPRQPCSWRWTLGRLDLGSPLRSVRVVGGLAESQLEVADRGRGWRGRGLPDGGRLSHLHPSSVAMETVRAPSPVHAATAAAA